MSYANGCCKLMLAQLQAEKSSSRDQLVPFWSLEIKREVTTIGSAVDGAGQFERPGIATAHAKVRRDRYGVWFLPLNNSSVLLNSNPLTAQGEIALIKGDRLRLGSPRLGEDLVLICTAELEAANSKQGLCSRKEKPEEVSDWNSSPQSSQDLGLLRLTPAEYEIVAWMGRGVHDINEIAGRLFRSVNTVRTQLNRIYDKLAVHSKAELLALVVQNWLDFQNRSHPLQRAAGTCDCLVGEQVS